MESAEVGWEYSIQKLIAHGHKFSEIKQYTYKQFSVFVDAVESIERDERLVQLTLLRASRASDESYDKFRRQVFGM